MLYKNVMDLFTKEQFKRLANILDNVGQISLAGLIIPSVIGARIDVGVALTGLLITLLVWWTSLRLERKTST